MSRTAIIVGASSGIGAALADLLAKDGYALGLVARRRPELEAVAARLSTPVHVRVADVADPRAAEAAMGELIAALGGVDLVVISAAIGLFNPELQWEREAETLAVNVTGFAAVATAAMRHFQARGRGHLVGISSVAAIRAYGLVPAYGASKAFVSRYLQGLRHWVAKKRLPICITDIQPGFVDTRMAQGEGLFWVAPVGVAAKQIYAAIRARRTHAYVTRRWRLVAWLMRVAPDGLYNRI